jgi:LPXTG-site transpeptidase (sortase) family protein
MPDIENGNLILAGHSGNARVSYFKNLNKLKLDDTAIIIYNNKEYNYKVVDIYEIDKTGDAEIIRDENKNTLTLITCKHNTKKQIVIICEMY